MKNDVWRAPRSNDAREILNLRKSLHAGKERRRIWMNTDKWKRILAGFLAILCLLTSPMSALAPTIWDAKEQFCGKETDNEQ